MSVKLSFFIYLSICFFGTTFGYIPFNPYPYVNREQYYISNPIEKETLVQATKRCLSRQMELASIDNSRHEKKLLDKLWEDYNQNQISGTSEFWVYDMKGYNDLRNVIRSVGYSWQIPHYNSGPRCVKLVFTPFNTQWEVDSCLRGHRFICTEKSHSERSLLEKLKQKTKSAFTKALDFVKHVKDLTSSVVQSKAVKLAASTIEAITKQVMQDILAASEGSQKDSGSKPTMANNVRMDKTKIQH